MTINLALRTICLGLCATGAASALFAQTSPRAVPLRETVHGMTLTDEYRWMEEDANKDEVLAFIRTENQRTRAMLDALPERAWFANRLKEIGSDLDRVNGYSKCGDTVIIRRVGAGDKMSKLYRRDKSGERLWLDPLVVTGNPLGGFGEIALSPDCRVAAINTQVAGDEKGQLRLFDVATGKQMGEAIPRVWSENPGVFTTDGRLIYGQMADPVIDGDPLLGMTTRMRSLDGSNDVLLLGNGKVVDKTNFPSIWTSSLSPWAVSRAGGATVDYAFYIAKAAALAGGEAKWTSVATLDDKVGDVAAVGSNLYLMTTKTNMAGTIVRRPIGDDGSLGAPTTVIEGRPDLLLRGLMPSGDGLYLLAAKEGAARLLFQPKGGGAVRDVALPGEVTIVRAVPDSDDRGIAIATTGWNTGVAIQRLQNGKVMPTPFASQTWPGAAEMVTQRLEATSADGTKIPMVVQRRKGATGRVPTMLDAYGGYGMDTIYPGYSRFGMAWLDKGGAQAYCGVRGGGERGRDWHEGGRGPNKPRGMEDLAACAHELVRQGIAPAKGPWVEGGSMGGALVPTATERFPDAFGAMTTSVGIVNASRIGAAENGTNQFLEIGDPSNPAQFRDLVAMDAYQMLTWADHLPPTLMVIGLNDRRVSPWMTAKWMARARAKWPDAPIWLHADDRVGHGSGGGEDVARENMADQFGWAWHVQSMP
jgi:prolyl oligopeptidase